MTVSRSSRHTPRPIPWRRVVVAALGSVVAGLVLVWPAAWLFGIVISPGDRGLVLTLFLASVALAAAVLPIFASTWWWHRLYQPGWPLGIVLMFVGSWLAGALLR